MKEKVVIQEEACTGCGLCTKVCSRKILKTDHGKVSMVSYPDWECGQCGLCMSICPTQAIRVEGAKYADFDALVENEVDSDILEGMLLSRRSMRSFKDRSVDRLILDKVIQISAMSPVGSPPTNVQVMVVDRAEHLNELYQDTIRCWNKLIQSMRNPIYRFVIRRVVGANMLLKGANWFPCARVPATLASCKSMSVFGGDSIRAKSYDGTLVTTPGQAGKSC